MQTILATIAFFGVIVALMAVGVMLSGRALRGSCGGTGEACQCDRKTRKDCELRKAADRGGA